MRDRPAPHQARLERLVSSGSSGRYAVLHGIRLLSARISKVLHPLWTAKLDCARFKVGCTTTLASPSVPGAEDAIELKEENITSAQAAAVALLCAMSSCGLSCDEALECTLE